MAGITLEVAQEMLDLLDEAELKLSTGQSYTIAGRSLTRADAEKITDKIKYWDQQVNRLSSGSGGGMNVRGITPVDG